MNRKRIGDLEITTFPDSEGAWITFWCTDQVSQRIDLRSNEDVMDLQYAVECIQNEKSRRAAMRACSARESQ